MELKPLPEKSESPLSLCDSMEKWSGSEDFLHIKTVGLLIVSFFLIAYGQPARFPLLGLGASAFGLALFWRAMLCFPSSLQRFWLSAGWFFASQLIQLSWMSQTQYMGPFIVVVYIGVNAALGLQFAALSLWVGRERERTFLSALALAGLWTLLEWSRLFLLDLPHVRKAATVVRVDLNRLDKS